MHLNDIYKTAHYCVFCVSWSWTYVLFYNHMCYIGVVFGKTRLIVAANEEPFRLVPRPCRLPSFSLESPSIHWETLRGFGPYITDVTLGIAQIQSILSIEVSSLLVNEWLARWMMTLKSEINEKHFYYKHLYKTFSD